MKHFSFIAGDDFNLDIFKSYACFLDSFPDFQTVQLRNSEMTILTSLMGIDLLDWTELEGSIFDSYTDISQYTFPEFNEIEMERFFETWIERSAREHNMDEWGSLFFLTGLTKKWNRLKYRMIVAERIYS